MRTDFNRWKDEDDSDVDEPVDDFNLEQVTPGTLFCLHYMYLTYVDSLLV